MDNKTFDPDKIGRFIKGLRKTHHLTQEQLGEQLFITRKAVSKWETGRACPSIDILKKISNDFGVTLEDIIDANFEKLEELKKRDTIIYKTTHNRKVRIGAVAVWVAVFLILAVFFITNFNTNKVYLISYEDKDFSLDNGVIVFSNRRSYINLGTFYANGSGIDDEDEYRFELYLKENNKDNFVINCELDRMVVIPKDLDRKLKRALDSQKKLLIRITILKSNLTMDLNLTVKEKNNFKRESVYNKVNIYANKILSTYCRGKLPVSYKSTSKIKENNDIEIVPEYIDLSFIYNQSKEKLLAKYEGKILNLNGIIYSISFDKKDNSLNFLSNDNNIKFFIRMDAIKFNDEKSYKLRKEHILYLNDVQDSENYKILLLVTNKLKEV